MNGRARVAGALVLALAGLAGCSKPIGAVGASDEASVMVDDKKVAGDAESRRATLATTRHVEMEVAPDAIGPLFSATQAACDADTASQCVVLKSGLSNGQRNTRANLVLRAAPAGIARVLAKLRVNGGLVSESAASGGLAAPFADTERQLAMAREYRDSLLALRAKGSNDIKTMMSVNEELAKVQSTLESATGERAHLQQRVATETLTVSIATTGDSEREALAPIGRSLRGFGADLGQAAASAITFVAYAIPWFLVLLPLAWLARRLWRRRSR
ncbi:MAG: DUF4349 domain-containing protein [Caulobacter sp.]|nr:DUF4349 domain-containing protein [Vitreoscilla sp.]